MIFLLNSLPATSEPDRITYPHLDNFADDPLYNTKAAVHLSGVPAPTLRAWERRYGVLSPERAGNTYRLYSERDVAKIRWLREQIERGISIRQAVALLERLDNREHQQIEEAEQPLSTEKAEQVVPSAALNPSAVADLSLNNLRQDLLKAFLNLNEEAAEKVIAGALAIYGVEEFCISLLEPTLFEIGEKWAKDEVLVTIEHFASAITRSQLSNLIRTAPRNQEGSLVLTGCAPGEYHEIGVLMITLFLRRQGIHVMYLGQNVPAIDFITTIKRLHPTVVCLSCSTMDSLSGLLEVSAQIEALPEQIRPTFSFGGYLFNFHPDLAKKLSGQYLGMDALEATRRIREITRRPRPNPPNSLSERPAY
ncbi:MAG: cobalamin-dependent protein [Chloroflexota bacterium]|nr:cobalamin B12-binding domain-containing protein [Chloroflexota bacterium]